MLALIFFVLMERTRYEGRTQLWLGIALLTGILLQSSGFFVHILLGEEGTVSPGTWVTRGGAILLAIALISLGMGLLRATTTEQV